jgi:predicted aspartyl protease
MTRAAFDESFDPPAPVLPVHVGGLQEHHPGVMLSMLVDTGADCTLVPIRFARSLALPLVDRVQVQGVGGGLQRASVFAARVQIGTLRTLARVVGFGDEALLGRDILNGLSLRIDGPAGVVTSTAGRKASRK